MFSTAHPVRLTYQNGMYDGYMIGDVPNGKGTYTIDGYVEFDGLWEDGKYKKGTGKLYNSHVTYIGDIENNVAHGFGKYVRDSHVIHEGRFLDGVPDGEGVEYIKDNIYYHGDFSCGTRYGRGTLCLHPPKYKEMDTPLVPEMKQYEIFSGNWVKGKRNGYGEETPFSGVCYRGNYENDVKSGYGVQYFDIDCLQDGLIMFDGMWENDTYKYGIQYYYDFENLYPIIDRSSHYFIGTFYNNQRAHGYEMKDGKITEFHLNVGEEKEHEYGIWSMSYNDNTRYEGMYMNGERAVGRFYQGDKLVYSGQWLHNVYHGKGCGYVKDIYGEGLFHEGDFVCGDVYKNEKFVYRGFLYNNKYNGLGTFIHSRGYKVAGVFRDNKVISTF